jgi:transcriptional regulator with XRE-family HTH domain
MAAQGEDVRIARVVKARRLKLGLSQADLGARIGVSAQAIHKIEAGQMRLSSKRVMDLAEALGIAPIHLFHSDLKEEHFNLGRTRREVERFLEGALALSRIRDKQTRHRLLDEAKRLAREQDLSHAPTKEAEDKVPDRSANV